MGDRLGWLKADIHWERFRPVWDRLPHKKAKGPGGRPRYDRLLLFMVLILQQPHNRSDAQMEFQVRVRLSFQRFLDLDLGDAVPDEKTLRAFCEALSLAGLTKSLFDVFHEVLREAGYVAWAGQIVDAIFVPAPSQRIGREKREGVNLWARHLRIGKNGPPSFARRTGASAGRRSTG